MPQNIGVAKIPTPLPADPIANYPSVAQGASQAIDSAILRALTLNSTVLAGSNMTNPLGKVEWFQWVQDVAVGGTGWGLVQPPSAPSYINGVVFVNVIEIYASTPAAPFPVCLWRGEADWNQTTKAFYLGFPPNKQNTTVKLAIMALFSRTL